MTEINAINEQEAFKTYQETQNHIIAQAWKDEAYREELLSNSKAVFEREFGVKLPATMNVNVLEETNENLYLVLPKRPDFSENELSDEQLEAVAGGSFHICLGVGIIIGLLAK